MMDLAPSLMLAAAAMLADANVDTDLDARALSCLALNVYHESRGEPVEGQLAVAHVTLNRAESSGHPDDLCAVVTEANGASCQFGWWCDGRATAPRNERAFQTSLKVAMDAVTGAAPDPTDGATFFVSSRLNRPGWTQRLTQTAQIHGHVFFRQ
jgi:spore germination cell wall hydrolase CwlJ-like protein